MEEQQLCSIAHIGREMGGQAGEWAWTTVCVCACVRACVLACVRACVCARARVCAYEKKVKRKVLL